MRAPPSDDYRRVLPVISGTVAFFPSCDQLRSLEDNESKMENNQDEGVFIDYSLHRPPFSCNFKVVGDKSMLLTSIYTRK